MYTSIFFIMYIRLQPPVFKINMFLSVLTTQHYGVTCVLRIRAFLCFSFAKRNSYVYCICASLKVYICARFILARSADLLNCEKHQSLLLWILAFPMILYGAYNKIWRLYFLKSWLWLVHGRLTLHVVCNQQIDSRLWSGTSRKHLRTKVTQNFQLTYIKNGGDLGSKSKW